MTTPAIDGGEPGREPLALGIELGSTRIKACAIDRDGSIVATGEHAWENRLVDGHWSYGLDAAVAGVQAAYAGVAERLAERSGARPDRFSGIAVSGMMHGYLAFDADDRLLTPFRTWRNTSAAPAAELLSDALGVTIPRRWSAAHLLQAVLDDEPHVAHVRRLATLSGWLHRLLTGRHVLGVGDASGMFPLDVDGAWDAGLLERFDALLAERSRPLRLVELLPEPLRAGEDAGTLTAEGAALLDPTGSLQPGAPLAPPEGDAGTGMVATGAVRPRTGNVSVGTSIFAMVVLEGPLQGRHTGIDLVATPAGAPVAMVHCNNGSAELGAWAGLLAEFAAATGNAVSADEAFDALLSRALDDDAPAPLAYGLLSGEPVAGVADGRPVLVRGADVPLTLAGLGRAQLFGVFAALSIGMRALTERGVRIDRMLAHGGLMRAGAIARRALAAALDVPVATAASAGEGGAWGAALLASYRAAVADGSAAGTELADWLDAGPFAGLALESQGPEPEQVAAFAAQLERWRAGLPIVDAAAAALPGGSGS